MIRNAGQRALILVAIGCSASGAFAQSAVNERNIRAQMEFLAGDAMQGRGSRTIFERIAAAYVGSQFEQFGLQPAGELNESGVVGFVQTVNISQTTSGTDLKTVGTQPSEQVVQTWNAIGKISGSDQKLRYEVIVVSAHLDHRGVRPDTPGNDKIFNGADDDASGTVAVLELARVLAAGRRPKRTVYFICFGSEESGGFGSRYFVNNLPFPKEKLVANLHFEMLGRPDPKVRPDELWLTGYERSDLGPELTKRGAKLVQDPRPEQNFFRRSDNYRFALQGIIAHTVSSFGLHADYHKPSDELKTIDFGYMTRAINSMVEPIRWFANSSFRPTWNEGKRPDVIR